ncbi:MAG: Clp protease ClpP [Clostridia bacterium]|nr:Clp protease ClpP [Clostridia bacterium]
MKKKKFLNAALIDDVGRIDLWGEVMAQKPVDWWTGETLDVECITPQDFKEALQSVKNCNRLELHLNSIGGDATVGLAIHNLLREENKHITCVVDGLAASAAFTIMCAADEVQVYPGSIMMCHDVMSFLYGYYNNEELKKVENSNEAFNNSAANIYADKSGMSVQQIRNMMKKEKWMVGQEAIDLGFANTLLAGDTKDAPKFEISNKGALVVNGIKHRTNGLVVPQEVINSIDNLGGSKEMGKNKVEEFMTYMSAFFTKNKAEDEENKVNVDESEEEKEQKKQQQEDDAKAQQEQEEKENALKVEVANSAIAQERQRLQEIEKISNSIDADLVQEAKFGETACDAKELAYRSMQREAEKANKALSNLNADAQASNVNSVITEQGNSELKTAAEKHQDKVNEAKALNEKINKAKGGV